MLLVKSRKGRLHLGKYVRGPFVLDHPSRPGFWTTFCHRGYHVKQPLWEFIQLSDKPEFSPYCHWCMKEIKNDLRNKYIELLVLRGCSYRGAAKIADEDLKEFGLL